MKSDGKFCSDYLTFYSPYTYLTADSAVKLYIWNSDDNLGNVRVPFIYMILQKCCELGILDLQTGKKFKRFIYSLLTKV